MHALERPVLALALDAVVRVDGEDALCGLLTLFHKCKQGLQEGDRLENMAWRLWHVERTATHTVVADFSGSPFTSSDESESDWNGSEDDEDAYRKREYGNERQIEERGGEAREHGSRPGPSQTNGEADTGRQHGAGTGRCQPARAGMDTDSTATRMKHAGSHSRRLQSHWGAESQTQSRDQNTRAGERPQQQSQSQSQLQVQSQHHHRVYQQGGLSRQPHILHPSTEQGENINAYDITSNTTNTATSSTTTSKQQRRKSSRRRSPSSSSAARRRPSLASRRTHSNASVGQIMADLLPEKLDVPARRASQVALVASAAAPSTTPVTAGAANASTLVPVVREPVGMRDSDPHQPRQRQQQIYYQHDSLAATPTQLSPHAHAAQQQHLAQLGFALNSGAAGTGAGRFPMVVIVNPTPHPTPPMTPQVSPPGSAGHSGAGSNGADAGRMQTGTGASGRRDTLSVVTRLPLPPVARAMSESASSTTSTASLTKLPPTPESIDMRSAAQVVPSASSNVKAPHQVSSAGVGATGASLSARFFISHAGSPDGESPSDTSASSQVGSQSARSASVVDGGARDAASELGFVAPALHLTSSGTPRDGPNASAVASVVEPTSAASARSAGSVAGAGRMRKQASHGARRQVYALAQRAGGTVQRSRVGGKAGALAAAAYSAQLAMQQAVQAQAAAAQLGHPVGVIASASASASGAVGRGTPGQIQPQPQPQHQVQSQGKEVKEEKGKGKEKGKEREEVVMEKEEKADVKGKGKAREKEKSRSPARRRPSMSSRSARSSASGAGRRAGVNGRQGASATSRSGAAPSASALSGAAAPASVARPHRLELADDDDSEYSTEDDDEVWDTEDVSGSVDDEIEEEDEGAAESVPPPAPAQAQRRSPAQAPAQAAAAPAPAPRTDSGPRAAAPHTGSRNKGKARAAPHPPLPTQAELDAAAAEAARQRDLFQKYDRRSYTDLARARTASAGLLSQIFHPDPEMFPPDHPYRWTRSTQDILAQTRVVLPPGVVGPTGVPPQGVQGPMRGGQQQQQQQQRQARPAPGPSGLAAARPPPGLLPARGTAVGPLAAAVTASGTPTTSTSILAASGSGAPRRRESDAQRRSPLRLRGRPEGVEVEGSDTEDDGNTLHVSASVAEQRLAALQRRSSQAGAGQQQQQQQQLPPQQRMQRMPPQLGLRQLPTNPPPPSALTSTAGGAAAAAGLQALPVTRATGVGAPWPGLSRVATAPAPIVALGYPYNLPPPEAPSTPRTTRRNMLTHELSESLRRNLLWERQVSKQRPMGLGRRAVSNAAAQAQASQQEGQEGQEQEQDTGAQAGPSNANGNANANVEAGLSNAEAGPSNADAGPSNADGTQRPPIDEEREERKKAALARNKTWADNYYAAGW